MLFEGTTVELFGGPLDGRKLHYPGPSKGEGGDEVPFSSIRVHQDETKEIHTYVLKDDGKLWYYKTIRYTP